MDVEHETAHYHRWSVALTDGQGIPDHVEVAQNELSIRRDQHRDAG